MLNWLWNALPDKYRWSVAIKKIAYTMAKFGIGAIAGTKIGQHVNTEHWAVVTEVSGALIAGGLTWLHDYLHMKYPEKKWL